MILEGRDMKICMISRAVNKCGGISRYVAEIAERVSVNNEVHILSAWCDLSSPNFILQRYSIPRKPYFLQIAISFLKVSSLARKLYEKFNFDVIHSSECEGTYQDIITAHSCVRGAYEKLKRNNLFIDAIRRARPFVAFGLDVEKLIYAKRKYKKIIAVSEGVKNELIRYYRLPNEDIVVIPNGVDLEEFKPDLEKRRKIREKHGIEENEIVLMFSGHEFKRKGLEYIIRALPDVKEYVKLLVIGKDNPEPYKKLASKFGVSNKIIFAGFVLDISEYYAASDVFVFPTLYEPFGLVITEALASGLPVIVSEFAGATDIMNDGREGLLLKNPTNPKEIAEKVNILVEDENLRKQMSRNARKTAEKYSWDIITEKTLKVYEDLRK